MVMVFITIYMVITNYMAVVMDLYMDMDQEIVIFMADMADMVDMADMTYMEDMADMEQREGRRWQMSGKVDNLEFIY